VQPFHVSRYNLPDKSRSSYFTRVADRSEEYASSLNMVPLQRPPLDAPNIAGANAAGAGGGAGDSGSGGSSSTDGGAGDSGGGGSPSTGSADDSGDAGGDGGDGGGGGGGGSPSTGSADDSGVDGNGGGSPSTGASADSGVGGDGGGADSGGGGSPSTDGGAGDSGGGTPMDDCASWLSLRSSNSSTSSDGNAAGIGSGTGKSGNRRASSAPCSLGKASPPPSSTRVLRSAGNSPEANGAGNGLMTPPLTPRPNTNRKGQNAAARSSCSGSSGDIFNFSGGAFSTSTRLPKVVITKMHAHAVVGTSAAAVSQLTRKSTLPTGTKKKVSSTPRKGQGKVLYNYFFLVSLGRQSNPKSPKEEEAIDV